MMKYLIFQMLGIGLLILGVVSGIVLFLKAATSALDRSDSSTATLWGIFLIGLIAGIIIIAAI